MKKTKKIMVKKLIIAINDNKALTIGAVVLGILIGIFGIDGKVGIAVAAATAAAMFCEEALRRAFNKTWSSKRLKRWMLLTGLGLDLAVLIAGIVSCFIRSAYDILWITAILSAVFTTISTAITLCAKGISDFNSSYLVENLVMWGLYIGIIITMAVGTYSLVLLGTGSGTIAGLVHDPVIIYGAIVAAALIAIFLIVLIGFLLRGLWEKLVDWASK